MRNPLRLGATGLAAALALGALALPSAADTDPPPAPDELAVSVVHSSSGSGAAPVSIRLIDSGGTVGGSIDIPTGTGEEGQHDFVLRGGDNGQQGALQRSADGQWLTIGGFDAPVLDSNDYGSASSNINSTFAGEHPRVVARIGTGGAVDVSTAVAEAFSESHIRGVASVDGSEFWAGGHGNNDTADPAAGVVHSVHGDAEASAVVPGTSGQLRNHRVPVIHDGQLYVSSDRSDYSGIVQVGTGLPTETIAEEEFQVVAPTPEGSDVPHDFAFVGEHLYVAYTEGDAGIVRYSEDGGSWEPDGILPGDYWNVTGRVAGDEVVLYAVEGESGGNRLVQILDAGEIGEAQTRLLAQAGTTETFRGVAFAPGFEEGEEPVEIPSAVQVDWDVRVAYGNGNALAAVLDADANPVATGQLAVPEELAGADLTAVVTSSDEDVITGEQVDVAVAEDGAFTLAAEPLAPGTTVLTLELFDGEESVGTSTLHYWVTEALPEASARAHMGIADASTAQDVGDGHFLAADDDTLGIRLYGPDSGEPVGFFPIHGERHENIPYIRQPGETWDTEASARIDDTIFWVGSLGNSRSGNVRDDRDTIAASTVSGSGAETELEFAGYARGFKDALVAWDEADGHGLGAGAFQFERATQQGYSAEGPNSLNVEGAAVAPDGESLWLGFRSPLVDPEAEAPVGDNTAPGSEGDQALVVEIGSIEDVVVGDAEIEVTDWFTLDLDGRAIRGMANTEDGNYAIQAGSADDEGNFAIYGWTGEPQDAPVASATPLGMWERDGSYESLPLVPSLADGTTIRVIQDTGTVDLYGTGDEAQDLIAEHMMFFSHDHVLDFDGAFGEVVPGPGDPGAPAPEDPAGEVPSPEPSADEVPAGGSAEPGSDREWLGETGVGGILAAVLAALVLTVGGLALARSSRA